MDQETITEAPGNDSGADTSAGITTEAELANSFLERVEEQPEEKPTSKEHCLSYSLPLREMSSRWSHKPTVS